MKAVGIKNLKNQLSKYLNMVREGEVIFVTDRDDIIAEIHKPTTAYPPVTQWEAFLNLEEKKGSIIRAKNPNIPVDEVMRDAPPWPKELEKEAQKIYEDVRSDRF